MHLKFATIFLVDVLIADWSVFLAEFYSNSKKL